MVAEEDLHGLRLAIRHQLKDLGLQTTIDALLKVHSGTAHARSCQCLHDAAACPPPPLAAAAAAMAALWCGQQQAGKATHAHPRNPRAPTRTAVDAPHARTHAHTQDLQQHQTITKPVGPHEALALLRERGVVEQLARTITAPPLHPPPPTAAETAAAYLPPKAPAPPAARWAGRARVWRTQRLARPLQLGCACTRARTCTHTRTHVPSCARSPGRTFLHIKVLGGSAFTDYLTRPAMPGEQLVLSLEAFGQRLEVAPVPACTDPQFRGEVGARVGCVRAWA